MYWCVWHHTTLSLIIETEWVARSTVSTSRSHMTTVVLFGFFALCSLSWVACPWSLLDDLFPWLCSVRCSFLTNTRNPPFEYCYEDKGVENALNITVIVYVFDWTLDPTRGIRNLLYTYCDNYYSNFCTRTVTCGTNPLFQFLYCLGTINEIIIVTINVIVNSEVDTFCAIGHTCMFCPLFLIYISGD
jgi:hypothetical protein